MNTLILLQLAYRSALSWLLRP